MELQLHDLIKEADLPKMVADFAPESKAVPGKPGVYFASWRGNHESPAFSIQRWKGSFMWKDQATGEAGNAYSFATKVMGLSNTEAIKLLEEYTGKTVSTSERKYKKLGDPDFVAPRSVEEKLVDQSFNNMMAEKLGGPVPAAIRGRGFLSRDMAQWLMVGDGDDLIFPIFNHENQIVSWKRRFHDNPKKRYSYELTGHGGVPQCIDTNREYIFITEGELNAMIVASVFRSAGENRIGFMGIGGAEGGLSLRALDGKVVYIYADPDEPGSKAREQWREAAIFAGAKEVWDVEAWSTEEDFCDIAGRSRQELYESLKNAMATAIRMYSPYDRDVGGYTVTELLQMGDDFLDPNRKGIMTGFVEIDLYTGGLPESGVVLIGALPSFGKSSLMRSFLQNHLKDNSNSKVALFSPDQSIASILKMMACENSGIPLENMKQRRFYPKMLDVYGGPEGVIKHWKRHYEDLVINYTKRFLVSQELRMESVMAMLEPMIDRGVTMIAGDYGQQFKLKGLSGNEHDEQVAMTWKEAARKWKLPVILPVQLAKSKFGKNVKRSGIPTSNDIEGTGAWYAVAETALLIYNQDMYMKEFQISEFDESAKFFDQNDIGKARIIVSKHKEGSRGDFRYLEWDARFAAFRNPGERKEILR